jgi:ubiquinone/menaquinone biosynthesis C-methylase UbiE
LDAAPLEEPAGLCYNLFVPKERPVSQVGVVNPGGEMAATGRGAGDLPGPADVEYFSAAQAANWGETLRAFARFVALPPGQCVLDVGTGPGLLARVLVEGGARRVVGCDGSLPMLQRAVALAQGAGGATEGITSPAEAAKAQPTSGQPLETSGMAAGGVSERADWVEGDARQLPFGDAAFDAAMATNLLFLLSNPAAGLAELVRVVARGGTVAFLNPSDVMSVPAARAFMDERGMTGFDRFSFVNYARLAEEHYRLSLGEWQALAAALGLGDLRHQARAGGMVLCLCGTRV